MESDDRAADTMSEELGSERLETKSKTFFLDLKKNDRGLFIKISERSGGRRSTIMVPFEHLDEFVAKLSALKAVGPTSVPASEAVVE